MGGVNIPLQSIISMTTVNHSLLSSSQGRFVIATPIPQGRFSIAAPIQAPLNDQANVRAHGDDLLARRYMLEAPRNIAGTLVEVPADSTLGHWRHQLAKALMSEKFQAWAAIQGIELRSMVIYPFTDNLSARVHGKRSSFSLVDYPEVAEALRPILAAAKVLTCGQLENVHYSDAFSRTATVETVAQFYNVAHGTEGYAALWRTGGFPVIAETDSGRSAAIRGEAALAAQGSALTIETPPATNVRQQVAAPEYLADVAGMLRRIAGICAGLPSPDLAIAGFMYKPTQMPDGKTQNFATVLRGLGFKLPTSLKTLNALANSLDQQSPLSERARNDRQLAQRYIEQAVTNVPGASVEVPGGSTLGQWRHQLARALQTPKLMEWASRQRVELNTMVLDPTTHSVSASVNGERRVFNLVTDPELAEVIAPAMAAAKVLTSGQANSVQYADAFCATATVETIAQFYNVAHNTAGYEALQRFGSFPKFEETDTGRSPSVRGDAALATQRQSVQDMVAAIVPSFVPLNPSQPFTQAGEDALVAEYNRHLPDFRNSGNARIGIPGQSKLGKWLEVYRAHLETPTVKAWMREQGITNSVRIDPATGVMSTTINDVKKTFTLNDASGWAEIAGPILAIAKIIVPTPNQTLNISLLRNTVFVDFEVVGAFYGFPSNPAGDSLDNLNAAAPDETLRPAAQRSEQALDRHKLALLPGNLSLTQTPATVLRKQQGNRENLRNLAAELQEIATSVKEQGAPAQRVIAEQLANRHLTAHPDSTLAGGKVVFPDLSTLISHCGFHVPKTLDEVTSLAQRLFVMGSTPPLGNLGGGLSWPVPMASSDENKLARFLSSNTTGLPGLPLPNDGKGVLGYLLSGSSVTPEDLKNPAGALMKLLDSPKAERLGLALQTHLDGFSTDTSVYDYILSAIHLGLDPNKLEQPTSNKIAGFDMAQQQYWGKPPSVVLADLKQHLIDTNKTDATAAPLAAHIVLASTAPQFLIKDIPANVTIGSSAWALLAIAAAKIEAQTPGRVQNMTYAAVLAAADSINTDNYATQAAKYEALKDWGVINGVLPRSSDNPSRSQMEKVREAFNSQLTSIKNASLSMQTLIPTRKEAALDTLKEQFPTVDPTVFEAKVLMQRRVAGGRTYPAELVKRSMLDIVMEGEKLDDSHTWVSTIGSVPIQKFNTYAHSSNIGDAGKLFKQRFKAAIKTQAEGHRDTVKYLISNLPVADRKNFEFGKTEFFHTNDYQIGLDLTSPLALKKRGHTMMVKTTLNNEVNIYEINTHTGVIEKRNDLKRKLTAPYTPEHLQERKANMVSRTALFDPDNGMRASDSAEKPITTETPNNYGSSRTDYVAEVFVKSLGLNNEDLLTQAKGVTSFDNGRVLGTALDEFCLNLIPFRSAVVNFINGNVVDGLQDVVLDIFGLCTFGAGKVAQAAKTGSKVLSSLSKTAKVVKYSKFIGAALIDAVNPLGGVGDLLVGGARLVGKGVALSTKLFNNLRGASGSYDLLKAVSKINGVAATGSFKVADQTVEGGAVLHKGKWYSLDPTTQRPYGCALKDFQPTKIAGNGEINSNLINWLSAVVAPNPKTPDLPAVFRRTLDNAKLNHAVDFNRGYSSTGKAATEGLEKIPGYYPSMKVTDLKELAVHADRNAEEIGRLTKLIENRQASKSLEDAGIFNQEVVAAGGKSTGMPQNLYLAQADIASKGECAALVDTMALAIQHGAKDVLIANFFKAASSNSTPASIAWRKQLNEIHQTLRVDFHGSEAVTQVPYTEIIKRLGDAQKPTMIKISTQDHGLLGGMTIDDNFNKEWFFFDPNFGIATFPNQAAMERGLESTLNSGRAASTLKPISFEKGVPEFHISTFNDGDFLMSVPYNNPFALFNQPL